ncbi:glycosyltransferase family 55 protein [Plenodomus tracheiphilus IPT5]|uniref:Glycosyltransferase family 55 protein n=1 Tax=Plenodomus tracheiphilus IPT5 TaxID=1408161 RepID=A0A6A7BAI1_9PLEO|nr:glycosyltransferase family 55 protein [Plenodomus tracheiphilus IPT5]
MRLTIGSNSTCFGNVEIHETSQVIELDAGRRTVAINAGAGAPNPTATSTNVAFSQSEIHSIESKLAIIVPCMNEDPSILDGVLHGIPHECFIILVSNSNPSNFQAERELLTKFCTATERLAVIAHQGNEGLAQAFYTAGMPDLVIDCSGAPTYRIRNGKGEAMIIGTAIAKLIGKKHVGFIDADNLVAGAVHEYCKVYAAGLRHALHSSKSSLAPHAMVRIKWNSKPKVQDGKLVFEKSGRCSRVVNKWMNRLSNEIHMSNVENGNGTGLDVIETANAGEHAMTLDLAMKLRFATGYAVEPFQLINMWERFGSPAFTSPVVSRDVQVLQIETRNPHFHDVGKGNEHIEQMQVQGLSAIYHSELASKHLKEELRAYMKDKFPNAVNNEGVPEQARVYPPIGTMNFEVFEAELKKNPDAMRVVGYLQSVCQI